MRENINKPRCPLLTPQIAVCLKPALGSVAGTFPKTVFPGNSSLSFFTRDPHKTRSSLHRFLRLVSARSLIELSAQPQVTPAH